MSTKETPPPPPYPPVPPHEYALERTRCSICQNKVRRPIINAALDDGLSNLAISREMTTTGWTIGPVAVARHRRHYISKLTRESTGAKGRDLAIMVRDMTAEAIVDGRLSIEGGNWGNVAPGLRAQDTLDRRESKRDDKKTMLAIAAMLMGRGDIPAALLDDGNTIDGEATEVD